MFSSCQLVRSNWINCVILWLGWQSMETTVSDESFIQALYQVKVCRPMSAIVTPKKLKYVIGSVQQSPNRPFHYKMPTKMFNMRSVPIAFLKKPRAYVLFEVETQWRYQECSFVKILYQVASLRAPVYFIVYALATLVDTLVHVKAFYQRALKTRKPRLFSLLTRFVLAVQVSLIKNQLLFFNFRP